MNGARTLHRPAAPASPARCGTCGECAAGVPHWCIPGHAAMVAALRALPPDPAARLHYAELRAAVGA